MSALQVVLGVALVIEVLVKFYRNAFDPHDRIPAAWYVVAAIAFGLVTVFAFDLNVFRDHSPATRFSDTVGKVYTGLAIAGGSGLIHAVISRLNAGPVTSNPKGLRPPRPK